MKRLAQLFLTLGLTWLILSRVGVTWDEALASGTGLPTPHPGWLALATVALLLGFFLSALLWGRMIGELGGVGPGAAAAFRIVLLANLGRYLPGKVWPMAGLALLAKRAGGSATLGATAGVLGQSFALLATGVLALPLLAGSSESSWGTRVAVLLLLSGLALASGVPAVLRALLGTAFRIAKIPLSELPRIDGWFGPRWFARHLAVWMVYALSFVLFVRGLGFAEVGASAGAAFAAAYLLGYAAIFAPAGIGVREGFLIAFLRPDFGSAAVGIALLTRLWMTLVEVLPAAAAGVWELYGSSPLKEPQGEPAEEHGDARS